MKKIILLSLFLLLSFKSYSTSNDVVITGNRVSIRLSPSIKGELLDRAMLGDHFSSVTESNGWQGISAPDFISAWVHSDYVSNNIVLPKKLNVRIGPNKNYGVLAILSEGQEVNQIEVFNEWIKINPPSNSVVWISKDFVSNVINIVKIESSEESNEILEEELIENTVITTNFSFDLNVNKEQGLLSEFQGRLSMSKYGLYKLTSENGEDICFIRGRKYQLEPLINNLLLLSGKKYFIDDLDLPILQPNTIKIIN
ncbi:MAG: SH3 domain-containing protein [Verrucomicrobiota bacterium]|nr:SH3 domain-containing protein [Verrucomicrobiota bacterium]MEC8753911.1 SH3 domain-containing protein [Verrucomicrobiota bacterium]|tara:strand:+ start:2602 stop:3366 length:765 start_codon:yes stop_codon:yes gene_type:complete